MSPGTNRCKLLDRIRQYEMRERRQEMLECANGEVKWVLGGRGGERDWRQEKAVIMVGKNGHGGAQRAWF